MRIINVLGVLAVVLSALCLTSGLRADDDETQVQGMIQSIASPSFVVNGITITVDSNTEIRGEHDTTLAFGDLHIGDQVEVEGALEPDGTLLASKIRVENEDNEVELRGTIDSVGSNSIVVGGITVGLSSQTTIELADDRMGTFSDLATGLLVEIKGTQQTDGSILALKIKIETPQEQEIELKGMIESVGSDSIVVAGHTIVVDSTTELEGPEDTTITFSDLEVGVFVEVKGTVQSDGSILAIKIEAQLGGGGPGGGGLSDTGRISGLTSSALTIGSRHFKLGKFTKVTNMAGAKLHLSALAVGQDVNVKFTKQGKKGFKARLVRILS